MPESFELKHNTTPFNSGAYQSISIFQKGQKILYEGEEAEVISTSPMLIVKTRNAVVCGNIQKSISSVKQPSLNS